MLRAEVQVAWRTRAGRRHEVEGRENQDAVYVTAEHPHFDAVLMVADGMGGHPLPREAAQRAVSAAREVLAAAPSRRPEAKPGAAPLLRAALEAAHHAVSTLRPAAPGGARPAAAPHARAPGSTLTLAAISGDVLHLAHVGDGSAFLLRDGQARVLAGGEDRRLGNRPAQFLGQPTPLEPETHTLRLVEGDRLLLCTDGLTRYFGEAGPEALERILGRPHVEMAAIAGQLIAHARPAEYDDDTTVAVAEVTRLRAGDVPGAAPVEPPAAPSRPPRLPGALLALLGLALLVAGFAAGRLTAPHPPEPEAPPGATGAVRPADPTLLRGLPEGNMVLLDELRRQVYLLVTRPPQAGPDPVALQGFRINADGRFERAGRYSYRPHPPTLTDADGRVLPVAPAAAGASLQLVRGGGLIVNTNPPGAVVLVDGARAGRSPLRLTLAEGRHRVRVEGRGWSAEAPVEVIPDATVTLLLKAP